MNEQTNKPNQTSQRTNQMREKEEKKKHEPFALSIRWNIEAKMK